MTTALTTLGGETMGTRWSLCAAVPQGLALADVQAGVQAMLDRVDGQMSHWRPDSPLSRFNRAPAGSWHGLPTEFHTVLRHALWLARESGGAYDPTVGALVDAWGFGPGAVTLAPAASHVDALRDRVGWQRVTLDDAAPAVRQPGGASLDFSSIAKGYAVDLAGSWLDARGVTGWLLEVGGEFKSRGAKPGGDAWRVGIERADGTGEVLCALPLAGRAIATSGDYRRRRGDGARWWSHHVDPRSGHPATGDVAAVTVVADHAMHADPFGTTLMVLGVERGLAFARDRGLAVLLQQHVGDTLRVHATPAFEALLAAD